MFIALGESNGNRHLIAARSLSKVVDGLHHSVVIIDNLAGRPSVNITRIDEQDDRCGVVEVVNEFFGLSATSTVDKGMSKHFAWVVQHHHGGVHALPRDFNFAAE